MVWDTVLDRLAGAAILIVRTGISSMSLLIIAGALPFSPERHPSNPFLPVLRRISDRAAEPVRTIAPSLVRGGKYDLSPLIAVGVLILVGFGFETVLVILREAGR
jgi:uncharacterized protein YggT (Ycf19 family)